MGIPVMRDFRYRGKLNRMWKMDSLSIDDIVSILFRHNKHLIKKDLK